MKKNSIFLFPLSLICFYLLIKGCTYNEVEKGGVLGINNTTLDNVELLAVKVNAKEHYYKGTRIIIHNWDSMIPLKPEYNFLKCDLFASNDTIFSKVGDAISPFIIWNNISSSKLYYELITHPHFRDQNDNKVHKYWSTYAAYRIAIFTNSSDTIQYSMFREKYHKHTPYLGMRISKKYGIQGLFLCRSDILHAKATDLHHIYFPKGNIILQDTNFKVVAKNHNPYHGWQEE
jgi:hypothetical protein